MKAMLNNQVTAQCGKI